MISAYNSVWGQHRISIDNNTDLWAIGDVHGCKDEYFELCNKVIEHSTSRKRTPLIIQLGDMIDRGPYFEDLILNDPANYKVMGNHEYNFYLEFKGVKKCRSKSRQLNHEKILQLSEEKQDLILEQLIKRKSFFFVTGVVQGQIKRIIMSHAPLSNIDKSRCMHPWDFLTSTNLGNYCMRASSVDMEGVEAHNANVINIHGHQSWEYVSVEEQLAKQASYSSKVINLDSGCVYGGKLTAMNVFTFETIQVQSNVKVPH
jgi:hypothetical protein